MSIWMTGERGADDGDPMEGIASSCKYATLRLAVGDAQYPLSLPKAGTVKDASPCF